MILKVKTGNGDWKYYEGFYAAEVIIPPIDVGIEADEYHYAPSQNLVGSATYVAGHGTGVQKIENCPVIQKVRMVRLSYPSDKVIVFNTEGYLLNYEGKTIERL